MLFKDDVLCRLADDGHNIAQFVSFGPDLKYRHHAIRGIPAQDRSIDPIRTLLALGEQAVGVRSYDPASPDGKPFFYGLKTLPDVMEKLVYCAGLGLHTIVSEQIDINDGGVSGVILGDVIEFAPGDTPRCVERPGVCSLPRVAGLAMLKIVYDVNLAAFRRFDNYDRVEFTISSRRRGFRQSHVVIWQHEQFGPSHLEAQVAWPNRFSELLGDKTFGLLVARVHGCMVPRTTVINRSVAPFTFGMDTGSSETWFRTAPTLQRPGVLPTYDHWVDPFTEVQQLVESDGCPAQLPTVLAQQAVEGDFSGACAVQDDGSVLVEGVAGRGDGFMLGTQRPIQLPDGVQTRVAAIANFLSGRIGSVRFEWVHTPDGQVWVVQLHRGTIAGGKVLVPGEPEAGWVDFEANKGIEHLRLAVEYAKGQRKGLRLHGEVAVTSHLGDTVRRAGIPTIIA